MKKLLILFIIGFPVVGCEYQTSASLCQSINMKYQTNPDAPGYQYCYGIDADNKLIYSEVPIRSYKK